MNINKKDEKEDKTESKISSNLISNLSQIYKNNKEKNYLFIKDFIKIAQIKIEIMKINQKRIESIYVKKEKNHK